MKLRYWLPYLLLAGVVVSSCGSAPAPKSGQKAQWYLTGKHPSYPTTLYWLGVGSGSSLSAAKEDAIADLARQLKVNIKSVSQQMVQSFTVDDREYFRDELTKRTQALVDQTIEGVEVAETEHKGDEFYVLVVLNKNRYLNNLRNKLDVQYDHISKLMEQTSQLLSQGRLVPAVNNLLEAAEQIPDLSAQLAFYNALSPMPYLVEEQYSGPAIVAKARELLAQLHLRVEEGDRQTAAPGAILPKPVVIQAYLEQKGRVLPVAQLPLKATYENGKTAGKAVTGDDGRAVFHFTAVPGIAITRGQIRIRLNLLRLPEIFASTVENLEQIITYELQRPSQPLAVEVKDADGLALPKLMVAVKRALTNAGYTVAPNARYRLTGQVRLQEPRQLTLGGRKRYQVQAVMELQLVGPDGSQLGSLEIRQSGVAGEVAKAKAKALDSLGHSIPKRRLVRMLDAGLGSP